MTSQNYVNIDWKIKGAGFYKNGKKDGFFKQYFEDGKLMDKGIYEDGELNR